MGDYYMDRGEYVSAVKCYMRARDFCKEPEMNLDLVSSNREFVHNIQGIIINTECVFRPMKLCMIHDIRCAWHILCCVCVAR